MNCGGISAGGKKLPDIAIPVQRFQTMNWHIEKWGLIARFYNGYRNRDLARDAAQILGENIPVEVVHVHTGWTKINNKWCI